MFIEETGRKHYTIEEYKKITNYDNTKKVLNEIKLKLPDVPNINDISNFSLKRDEKILETKDNLSLHKELSKQSKIIDEAQKYQKERNSILADNRILQEKLKL